jgi:hypothetical protein
MLDGVFAFVLYDTRNKTFMAARDAIGVNPLYIGWGGDGRRLLPPHLSARYPFAFLFPSPCMCGRIQTKRGRQQGSHTTMDR